MSRAHVGVVIDGVDEMSSRPNIMHWEWVSAWWKHLIEEMHVHLYVMDEVASRIVAIKF